MDHHQPNHSLFSLHLPSPSCASSSIIQISTLPCNFHLTTSQQFQHFKLKEIMYLHLWFGCDCMSFVCSFFAQFYTPTFKNLTYRIDWRVCSFYLIESDQMTQTNKKYSARIRVKCFSLSPSLYIMSAVALYRLLGCWAPEKHLQRTAQRWWWWWWWWWWWGW